MGARGQAFPEQSGLTTPFSVVMLLGAVVAVALAPTVIAFLRRHPSRRLVAAANVVALLSWVAWLAVLVWAVTGRKSETIERLLRKRDRG